MRAKHTVTVPLPQLSGGEAGGGYGSAVGGQIDRRRAAAQAGHSGDANTARSLLSDKGPAVRATALAALARMGEMAEAELVAGLIDPDPGVRRRACALAIPHPGVDLVRLLSDTSEEVVEQAAWALGERTDSAGPAAVTALGEVATTHDDALCREAAVAALGAIGDASGLAAILTATTDKPAVRRRAVLALAPFDGPDVEFALERAKTDRDWQVRQAAEDLS